MRVCFVASESSVHVPLTTKKPGYHIKWVRTQFVTKAPNGGEDTVGML
jgi:hypothetical protein